jgi:ADP-ribose pyrophosphatase
MQTWKTLSRKTILDRSPYLVVEEHQIQLPDGRIIDDWTWVITPDFVIIVAITDEGKWLCFRQVKYAIGGITLAPVGGYIKEGEDPLVAAKRELREETGYEASIWNSMGKYIVDANRGKATGYLFLACAAHKVTEIDSDDLEEQQMLFLSRKEVETAVVHGKFKEISYQTAMALALLQP